MRDETKGKAVSRNQSTVDTFSHGATSLTVLVLGHISVAFGLKQKHDTWLCNPSLTNT